MINYNKEIINSKYGNLKEEFQFNKNLLQQEKGYIDSDIANSVEMYDLFKEQRELQRLIDYQIRERDFFQLKDLLTLANVIEIYSTKEKTLNRKSLDYRLKFLDEGYDYIKLGKRLPTLLTPKGVEKLLNVKEVKL